MAYTVSKLITRAYYGAGIVSREFETVSGSQLSDGLEFLNDLIGDKTIDRNVIPYRTQHNFNGVIGQEAYPIDDLITVDTLTFTINDVRYYMQKRDLDRYFGTSRVNNISTLPYEYHMERNFEGATIYVYFEPDDTYEFELWGLFRLSSVALNDDLELILDRFYINFLRFQLMERICDEFQYSVPAGVTRELERYYYKISKSSAPLDLKQKHHSAFGPTKIGPNYAQVNVGNGWR